MKHYQKRFLILSSYVGLSSEGFDAALIVSGVIKFNELNVIYF